MCLTGIRFMSRCRRARPFLMTLALLGSTSVSARAADEVSLKGGAFDQLTTVELTGTPGRKYLVLISVFNTPGMSYIPDVTYDIGSEFLNVSLAVLTNSKCSFIKSTFRSNMGT